MAMMENIKNAVAWGGVVVKAETPEKFHPTLDHYNFTATLTNKNDEPRVVENIDFRIRTAVDIANTGPAQQIYDGYHYLHQERVELGPKETKTITVTMPVFITAAAEDAGIKGAGLVGKLAKGALIAHQGKTKGKKKYVLQAVPNVEGFTTKRTFGKKLKTRRF